MKSQRGEPHRRAHRSLMKILIDNLHMPSLLSFPFYFLISLFLSLLLHYYHPSHYSRGVIFTHPQNASRSPPRPSHNNIHPTPRLLQHNHLLRLLSINLRAMGVSPLILIHRLNLLPPALPARKCGFDYYLRRLRLSRRTRLFLPRYLSVWME